MWPHRRGRPPCLPEQEGWCHERPKAWQEHRQGWSAEHSDARNPCLLCQQQFKPRRGDRILSGLRHLFTLRHFKQGFFPRFAQKAAKPSAVLRTSPPAWVLATPSGFHAQRGLLCKGTINSSTCKGIIITIVLRWCFFRGMRWTMA